MVKPINYEELVWCINALLWWAKIYGEHRIIINDVMLDAQIYAVTNGTDEMPLPKKEFDLLYKLLSDPSQLNKRQGMSLAIVQRIFELRQDKITVQSTAGSERIFTIMLP